MPQDLIGGWSQRKPHMAEALKMNDPPSADRRILQNIQMVVDIFTEM